MTLKMSSPAVIVIKNRFKFRFLVWFCHFSKLQTSLSLYCMSMRWVIGRFSLSFGIFSGFKTSSIMFCLPNYNTLILLLSVWTSGGTHVSEHVRTLLCLCLQVFAFDHCFWSMDESNVPKHAGELRTQSFSPHITLIIMDYIWYCKMPRSWNDTGVWMSRSWGCEHEKQPTSAHQSLIISVLLWSSAHRQTVCFCMFSVSN